MRKGENLLKLGKKKKKSVMQQKATVNRLYDTSKISGVFMVCEWVFHCLLEAHYLDLVVSCCNIPQNSTCTTSCFTKSTPLFECSISLHVCLIKIPFLLVQCFCIRSIFHLLKTLKSIPCMSSSLRVSLPYAHFRAVCTFTCIFCVKLYAHAFVCQCENANNEQYVCKRCLDSTLCCFCPH